MKRYTKYVFKDFSKLVTKLFAIILIVLLGVGFLVGLLTTTPNMKYSMKQYYIEHNMADLIIQSQTPVSENLISDLQDKPFVKEVMSYLSVDEQIEYNENEHTARIMLLDFENGISINKLSLVEGRLPSLSGENVEIVVEKSHSYLVDIPIGYTTDILGHTFEVVGIVQNPWYFAYVQEISPLTQRPIETMLYVDKSILPSGQLHNIAVTLNGVSNLDMFSEDYKDFVDEKVSILKNDYNDLFFITRNQNQSFVKFQSDIKIVEIIALIFPAFFFLITILVSMASITRIVSDQRSQIGTLRSLGYSKFKIVLKYLFYALITSGVGSVLGIGVGIYFIPAVIYNAYLNSYNLPILQIKYHFLYTSIISLSMVLSVALVTLFSVLSTLKERTTELMKVKSPKPGKKILVEKIPFIWNRLKFKYKSTFRNIFRHKRNLVLTLIGIIGSTALLVAGFGIKDSVDFAGRYQYDQMMQYNIEVGISTDESELLPIEEYQKILIMENTVKYSDGEYIKTIISEDSLEMNNFLKFKDLKRKDILMAENSVMITHQFADKHDIKVGDIITLEIGNYLYELETTDIVDLYFGNAVYISQNLIEHSELQFNKIYINADLDNDELNILKEELKTFSFVNQVRLKEEIKDDFYKTSSSMNSIIIVLLLSASALAIIINYNLTLININTRQKEIATLKVLGYHESEVSGYVFRETAIISLVAILLGLGFGRLLHYFIISQIIIDGVVLSNQINWLSYLLTLVLSMAFLGITYLISLPKTKKIDMIDALKSYD